MHSVKLPRAAMCTGASPTLFFAFTSHPGVRAHKNRPCPQKMEAIRGSRAHQICCWRASPA